MALANGANGDGLAWPSLTTIARDTALHRSTVARALAGLQGEGYLTITPGGPAGHQSSRYNLKAAMLRHQASRAPRLVAHGNQVSRAAQLDLVAHGNRVSRGARPNPSTESPKEPKLEAATAAAAAYQSGSKELGPTDRVGKAGAALGRRERGRAGTGAGGYIVGGPERLAEAVLR